MQLVSSNYLRVMQSMAPLFLPLYAKAAHAAQIPLHVQSVLCDGNWNRLGMRNNRDSLSLWVGDTRSQKAALVNQEPLFPGLLPSWMLSMETQQRMFQRKRWKGSLPPGQLCAAEEMHSPREHLDPVSGGLWAEVHGMSRPNSLQRNKDLLEAFQGSFLTSLSLTGRKTVSHAKRKRPFKTLRQSLFHEHQIFVLL